MRNLQKQKLKPWRLSWYLPPFKLRYFLGRRKSEALRLLDVGCGNHSPSITKRWLPNTTYIGVDLCENNYAPEDIASMERFIIADVDNDSLESIENGSCDVIIMAHVIEHLHRGEEVVQRLARKLRPGGFIYLECPAERSLRLPSAYHCLNFYDDPTHVRIYDLESVCSTAGLHIIKSGTRHDWILALLSVTILLPKQIFCLLRYRKLFGPGLWDILGFAKYLIAIRPQDRQEVLAH